MTATVSDLIPHRGSMQLIDEIVSVSENQSRARVNITAESSFYSASHNGVPSWIGVEYMGQTAALIAGHQLQLGTVEPHLGFLLGVRKYESRQSFFTNGEALIVACDEIAVVGNELATFQCTISLESSGDILASAKLSVLRKPLEQVQP